MTEDEPLSTKVANVLFKGAKINPAFAWPASAITLKVFRLIWGGLWVGGNISLYRDKLVFCPNAQNFNVHKAGTIGIIEIPIATVTAVKLKRGAVAGIVQITHGRNLFVFRCYGSDAFARDVLDAAGLSD
jgi:hypothetical protein